MIDRISATFFLLLLSVLLGCTHSSSIKSAASSQNALNSVSTDALLEDVSRTLNRLDDATVIDLTPPELVLDATTSRNRKEVLANFMDDPREPNGRYDIMAVVTNNGQFDRLQIAPGDQIRMFVDLGGDEFGKISTINMIVAEPLNSNALRVQENPFLSTQFRGQLPGPARIEIWRYSSERLRDLGERFQRYTQAGRATPGFTLPRKDSPAKYISAAVWEPTPDESALTVTLDRLNQWGRDQDLNRDWTPNPLTSTLPEQYHIFVSKESLSSEVFTVLDARNIQEAIWARDIVKWAAHDPRFTQSIWGLTTTADKNAAIDLEAATALFDWTVRHIQLDTADQHNKVPHEVWHTLLFGRGTLEHRAWVFTRLARQAGLDVVTLGVGKNEKGEPKNILSGLLLGDQIYLFDLELGLPLPGPGGQGICTLEQLKADPKLLEQLATDKPYRISAEDLTKIVGMIESSPLSLSQRGQLFESKLAGRTRFVVTGLGDPAIAQLQKLLGNESVKLWDLPYRTLDEQLSLSPENRSAALTEFLIYSIQPWLFKARVMHFQGKFDFDMTKKLFLPPNPTAADITFVEKYEHLNARLFYRRSRPADKILLDPKRPRPERELMAVGKVNASYWLGLMALDDGDYVVAIDFLAQRTLAAIPGGPWTWGAEYNLGRTHELLGDNAAAAKQYELSPLSPQSHGNLIRARKLLADTSVTPDKPATESPTEPPASMDEKPKETPDAKLPADETKPAPESPEKKTDAAAPETKEPANKTTPDAAPPAEATLPAAPSKD